jgi:two-component system alkaline phosphatase synthesis response regulator PhoP
VIRRAGQEYSITSLEAEILKYFISRQGEVVTRNDLLDHVWGYEKYPTTRTVDNHILKLRKKIEKDPAHPKIILSLYGEGYRFMG